METYNRCGDAPAQEAARNGRARVSDPLPPVAVPQNDAGVVYTVIRPGEQLCVKSVGIGAAHPGGLP